MIKTRAKNTHSLRRIVLDFMSLKKISCNLKGRNGMQKKRMRNKRMQINFTLNVTISLNVNF